MAEHPIQGLMKTAMVTLKEMVDVNTIVGDAVESPDGSVIVPISRVSFGFAAGGGEYGSENGQGAGGNGRDNEDQDYDSDLAFAGGSGGGVTINPVGFLVVGQGTVRMLPVDGRALLDRVLDVAPVMIREFIGMLDGRDGRREDHR
ncbi:MAG: GerW family sporulation protein [Bacillota bacterium]|nr:GerW family sporulation protein [Bacillota bacterium]